MTTLWQSLMDAVDPWRYQLRVLARLEKLEELKQLHKDRTVLQQLGFDDYSMKLYQERLLGIEQRCSKLEQF